MLCSYKHVSIFILVSLLFSVHTVSISRFIYLFILFFFSLLCSLFWYLLVAVDAIKNWLDVFVFFFVSEIIINPELYNYNHFLNGLV
jgi:hypothetical protein